MKLHLQGCLLKVTGLSHILRMAPALTTVAAFGGGTVNNCTQSDLQAATAGGGTVLFACSGTITLTNTIVITQDTVLDANGQTPTISGGGAVRLFQVMSNVNFRVMGLTLANGQVIGVNGAYGDPPAPGQDAMGAGILNQGGAVALINCTLTNHYVQGGLAGSDPTSNVATNGGTGFGAAICSLGGSLNLTNCTIAGNKSVGGSGSVPQAPSYFFFGNSGPAWGGAIYLQGAMATVENSRLTGNAALGAPVAVDPFFLRWGPGGDALGGALYVTNSTVVMSGSVLQANSATGGGVTAFNQSSGPGSGAGIGGVGFLSQDSTATITLSTFSGNEAIGGMGSHWQAAGPAKGGVFFNAGHLAISSCTFATNQSSPGIFGLYSITGSGGAIYSVGSLIVNASTFNNNSTVGGAPDGSSAAIVTGGDAAGGALWISGTASVTNCTLVANSASGGLGGGGGGPGPGGAGTGGGVLVAGGTASLVNLTVANNSAAGGRQPGDSIIPPGASEGGGLAVSNAEATVQNSIIAHSQSGGDIWGTPIDGGHNLVSDCSTNFFSATSFNSTDPLLGSLSNNGGPTATMALLPGSSARDAIPSGFPSTDQRGVSRPQGPSGDIGAFEADFVASPPVLVVGDCGNNLIMTFHADAGQTYRLLSSVDLAHWSAIATNSVAVSGPLQLVQPIATVPQTFFRVVTQ